MKRKTLKSDFKKALEDSDPPGLLTWFLRLLLLKASPELSNELFGVNIPLLPDGQRPLHRPTELRIVPTTVGVRERGLERDNEG